MHSSRPSNGLVRHFLKGACDACDCFKTVGCQTIWRAPPESLAPPSLCPMAAQPQGNGAHSSAEVASNGLRQLDALMSAARCLLAGYAGEDGAADPSAHTYASAAKVEPTALASARERYMAANGELRATLEALAAQQQRESSITHSESEEGVSAACSSTELNGFTWTYCGQCCCGVADAACAQHVGFGCPPPSEQTFVCLRGLVRTYLHVRCGADALARLRQARVRRLPRCARACTRCVSASPSATWQ